MKISLVVVETRNLNGHYIFGLLYELLCCQSWAVNVNIVSVIVSVESVTLPQWFSTGPAVGSTFGLGLSSNTSENLNKVSCFLLSNVTIL